MLTIQMRRSSSENEELRTICVGTGISHAQQSGMGMTQFEVLVVEGVAPEDTGAACAVTVEKVAALDHEVRDLEHGQSIDFGAHARGIVRTTRWKVLPLYPPP